MTHTETTHESACYLERVSRCLASLANAMSKPPTKKAREGLPTPSAMRSVMLRVQVRSFARPATRRHRNSTPVSGSRHACEISFLQVLTTQANRTVWPTTRAFFPNISVCLGERRGKDE